MAKEQLATTKYPQASRSVPANDNARHPKEDSLYTAAEPRRKERPRQTRAQRLAKVQQVRPELLRRVRASSSRNNTGRGIARKGRMVARALPESELAQLINRGFLTFKAFSIGITLISILTAISLVLVAIWAMGIVSISSETVPILNFFVPGTEIFGLTYFLMTAVWIILILGTSFAYMGSGIDCFSDWKFIVFTLCCAAQMSVFINIVPWMLIWVVLVMLFPTRSNSSWNY